MTVSYLGDMGTVNLSLWWSNDEITEHLLGWYRDGELTDDPAEATAVRLAGSYDLNWRLPANPNTLPRLDSGTR